MEGASATSSNAGVLAACGVCRGVCFGHNIQKGGSEVIAAVRRVIAETTKGTKRHMTAKIMIEILEREGMPPEM